MLLQEDKIRYGEEKMPLFQKFMRLQQETNNPMLKIIYKVCFAYFRNKLLIEMSVDSDIGGGYISDIRFVLILIHIVK